MGKIDTAENTGGIGWVLEYVYKKASDAAASRAAYIEQGDMEAALESMSLETTYLRLWDEFRQEALKRKISIE